MNSLYVNNLCLSFAKNCVLNINELTIAKGGISVITGASGSGKSTLLRCFNRLNEFFPNCNCTGGIQACIDNSMQSIYNIPIDNLRRQIGMVFQHPNVLPVSVIKNFTLPLVQGVGLSYTQAKNIAETMLRSVGLWNDVKNRLNLQAELLSGGQKQRLCFARAMALKPKILLLDEPTSSLDSKSVAEIEEYILEISKKITIILVTHSIRQAEKLGNYFFDLEKINELEK